MQTRNSKLKCFFNICVKTDYQERSRYQKGKMELNFKEIVFLKVEGYRDNSVGLKSGQIMSYKGHFG